MFGTRTEHFCRGCPHADYELGPQAVIPTEQAAAAIETAAAFFACIATLLVQFVPSICEGRLRGVGKATSKIWAGVRWNFSHPHRRKADIYGSNGSRPAAGTTR
jgi:hypothetical protein